MQLRVTHFHAFLRLFGCHHSLFLVCHTGYSHDIHCYHRSYRCVCFVSRSFQYLHSVELIGNSESSGKFTNYAGKRRKRNKQRNKQTTQQTNNATNKQRNKQTTQQTNNATNKQRNKQTTQQTNNATNKQRNKQTTQQTNNATNKQRNKQTLNTHSLPHVVCE